MGVVFWCASCGNPEIIVESDKEGYSMAKGLVGAAILGPVGAVAGLDGKETSIFYCPKCGARLKNPMPDYEVNSILQMLQDPENSRSAIEAKHKKYPNMMLPKGWTIGSIAEDSMKAPSIRAWSGQSCFEELERIIKTSTQDDIKEKLYDFFLRNEGVQVVTITKFYNTLSWDDFELMLWALEELQSSFKLRIEKISGVNVYVAAKNKDEIKAWRRESSADSIPVDDYLEFVQSLIQEKPRSIKEIEQEIISREPGINDDNPTVALSIAKRACAEMDSMDGLVEFDGERIRIRSIKLAEDDLRWEIEEKWKDNDLVRKAVNLTRAVLQILQQEDDQSLDEISEKAYLIKKQILAAKLKQLCDAGFCTKRAAGSSNLYSLSPEYKSWRIAEIENWQRVEAINSRYVEEEDKELAIRVLKKNGGTSFWNMMKSHLTNSEKTEKYYECFMVLELEGVASCEEKSNEYIWKYVDKNAAIREKLEKEKEQLLTEKERYKTECDKRIPQIEKLKKELQSQTFDDTNYISKISELEMKLKNLEARLSSLGLFSFKEKKEVNEKLTECAKKIEETKNQMDNAKKSFANEIKEKLRSYDKEIDNYYRNLENMENRKKEIIEKLSRLF